MKYFLSILLLFLCDSLMTQEIITLEYDNTGLDYRGPEVKTKGYLNNDLSDQKKIMNIKEQINKYGFEATAIKYSISSTASNKGDLGWLNAKSLNKKIFNLVTNIKVGEVTEPLITSNSALFLKLNDKKISKVENVNIDELKINLINRKKNEMFNLYSRSLLSKLKNNSLIEYN